MPDERPRPTRDERDDLIKRQQEDIARLRDELARTERERERDQLKRQNARLKQQLETARRAGSRQAAPFAQDRPQGRGGRPGRRAGARYGRRARRPIPAQVDETYAAPLPSACPSCGGAIQCTRVTAQYQEDLPVVRPIVRRFDVAGGAASRVAAARRAGIRCKRRMRWARPVSTSVPKR